MKTDGLKMMLALEPKWTVCIDNREYMPIRGSEIHVDGTSLRLGGRFLKIEHVEWLRSNIVRIRGRSHYRAQTITLYAGDQLPSSIDLRRRRRAFQKEVGRAIVEHVGSRKVHREMLYSDRQHGIGAAYPRFLAGGMGFIAVDPDESSAVVNGLVRAAILWASYDSRPITAVIPRGRSQTISSRLRALPKAREAVDWLHWDGSRLLPYEDDAREPETHVQEYAIPEVRAEVDAICALAPELLQAVPHIASKAVSIGLRGIEVARVSARGVEYPLGQPLAEVIEHLAAVRAPGSCDPLSRAHQERWLESNLIGQIHDLMPSIDLRHIYPQVPSFVGEERNIIDLLTVTKDGRLVIIEIKAAADPDLPYQALDYWIAVERHRKAGDFTRKGYFEGCQVSETPALLVLVAPLLSYHRTTKQLMAFFPPELPVTQIGINQSWKGRIQILHRTGMLS